MTPPAQKKLWQESGRRCRLVVEVAEGPLNQVPKRRKLETGKEVVVAHSPQSRQASGYNNPEQ